VNKFLIVPRQSEFEERGELLGPSISTNQVILIDVEAHYYPSQATFQWNTPVDKAALKTSKQEKYYILQHTPVVAGRCSHNNKHHKAHQSISCKSQQLLQGKPWDETDSMNHA
jgi:hypothetical protein